MEYLLLLNSILLWAIVLFNLLITFRLVQIVAPDVWAKSIPRLKTGQLAPTFKVETVDGNEVTLSSFKDTPLLLIFISLQCSSCLAKIPDFKTLGLLANHVGVRLGLICDSDQHKVRSLIDEFCITAPVFVAARENPIWKQYKISTTPFYCLIDERSRVHASGLLDSNLEKLIKVWKVNSL